MSLSRRHSRKDWKNIFVEKIKYLHDVEDEKEKKKVGQYQANIQGISLVRLVQSMRDRRMRMAVHPIMSVESNPYCEPQAVCNLCGRPNIADIVSCKCCHAAFHYVCVIDRYTSDILEDDMKDNLFRFTCMECTDLFDAEYRRSEQVDFLKRIKAEENLASIVINTWIIRQWRRRQQARRDISIKIIQHFVITSAIRRKYLTMKRRHVRVSILELPYLPSLDEDSLVTITVVDSFKNSQILRVDKFDTTSRRESFLLPGLTGEMTIVATICSKVAGDLARPTYVANFQAIVPLKDIYHLTKEKIYNIMFSSKITFTPTSSKDEVIINVDLNKNNIITEYDKSTNKCDCRRKSFPLKLKDDEGRFYADVFFVMYNSHVSFCGVVQGPIFEFLTKKHSLESDHLGGRTVPWWMCLVSLKLFIYVSYGASTPLVVKDMKDVIITQSAREKSIKSKPTESIGLLFTENGSKWNLIFQCHKDAVRFENQLIECLRKFKMPLNHYRGDDARHAKDFGLFD
jgi:hypothetical protein